MAVSLAINSHFYVALITVRFDICEVFLRSLQASLTIAALDAVKQTREKLYNHGYKKSYCQCVIFGFKSRAIMFSNKFPSSDKIFRSSKQFMHVRFQLNMTGELFVMKVLRCFTIRYNSCETQGLIMTAVILR